MDTQFVTHRTHRLELAAVASLVLVHFLFLMAWFQPAISTPDANGYFAQARLLALEGRSWFAEASPLQYEGMHWLKSPGDRLFSRYPPGFPLLLAAVYRLFGADASLLVNPLLASLSLGLLYLLARAWVGPGWGLLAAALMACNPIANEHALSADSHTAVAFFLLLALVCLERWSRGQRPGWAFATGLCLGIVPSVRYAEILFGLGFGAFVLASLRRDARPWRSLLAGVGGMAIPVAALAARNQAAFGAFWRTGYSLTNEQTGFGLDYFQRNALGYVENLLSLGSGPLLALGLIGIAVLCARRATWRHGLALALFVLPSTLLYMAYYWGGMGNGTGTMRFLLPTFFVYTLAAVWLLQLATRGLVRAGEDGAGEPGMPPRGHGAAAWAAGLAVLGLTALWGIPSSVSALRRLEAANDALARVTRSVRLHVPARSVVVAQQQVLQQLDFAGDWRRADESALRGGRLSGRPLARRAVANAAASDTPSPMQREKMLDRATKFDGLQGDALTRAVAEALAQWAGPQGRVFFVAAEAQFESIQNTLPGAGMLVAVDRIQMPQASVENARRGAMGQPGMGGPGGVGGPGMGATGPDGDQPPNGPDNAGPNGPNGMGPDAVGLNPSNVLGPNVAGLNAGVGAFRQAVPGQVPGAGPLAQAGGVQGGLAARRAGGPGGGPMSSLANGETLVLAEWVPE